MGNMRKVFPNSKSGHGGSLGGLDMRKGKNGGLVALCGWEASRKGTSCIFSPSQENRKCMLTLSLPKTPQT